MKKARVKEDMTNDTATILSKYDFLALVCGVFCEFVTFPLVSWVRCGT